MANLNWEDATSYDKYDERRVQTCWSLKSGALVITITKRNIRYQGEWVLSCRSVGLDAVLLGPIARLDATEAKREALRIVMSRVSKIKMGVQALSTLSEQSNKVR
ncbi:hypothetical protein PsAD13_03180 [Pseudovibrio sp. Ad13]|nr:hypothetical protein PsAD13_03180 [Pseudovibrio sp. Ad13]